MRLSSNKIGILFAILLCAGCTTEQQNEEWKLVSAKLSTIHTIDGDSSYYFAHPDYAATTSDNKLVIADRGLNKLMVFNEDGDYLYGIGEQGPGPAQFRDIKGLWINNGDTITVFDRNAQTFKQFLDSGKYQQSFVNHGRKISSGVSAEYVNFLPLLFHPITMVEQSKNFLLHLNTSDYDSTLDESLAAENLEGYTEMMIHQLGLAASPGSHLRYNDMILFIPWLYNGYIYMYKIDSSSKDINFYKKIEGLTYKKPLTEIDSDADYYDARLSGVNGEHKFYLHNLSLGLFKLNDGRIVHFTYIENEEGTARTFGAEIYTPEMEHIGYAKFHTKEFEDVVKSRLLGKNIRAKDSRDRFYLQDWTGKRDKYEIISLKFDK